MADRIESSYENRSIRDEVSDSVQGLRQTREAESEYDQDERTSDARPADASVYLRDYNLGQYVDLLI